MGADRATLGGIPVREEEPLGRHLPLRAATGTAERWVEVPDEAALLAVIRAARAEKSTIRPLCPFTDALPPEGGLTGVVLRLGRGFETIDVVEGGLRVGGAVPLALVGMHPGFELLRRAPGTLLDAWEEAWIAPALVSVRRFRGRGFEDTSETTHDAKSMLIAATLRPGAKLVAPRAGQAFREVNKRGVELRALLRRCGLGGLRLFGALLAEDDPAVLVNRGDATPKQLRLVLQAARERVQTTTGLEIEDRMESPGRGGRL
jgi:UDP-N-acetylenolpyruvoylglucosamine reductase